MVTKLPIAIAIGMWLGSGLAQPDLLTLTAVPASQTKVDFDQVFADVTWQGAGYVDRAHKSDRLPTFKIALPQPVLLPFCEPVASPFADPILSDIVGHCDA